MTDRFRFGGFVLDCRERRISRDDRPLDLNGRYLDALALLVREHGKLVSKDRFLADVWRGVPVTDEALTQCIRTLRRLLGDDAADPRFIATVPKHGYRFIASVEPVATDPVVQELPDVPPPAPRRSIEDWRRTLLVGAAGTAGGGAAGLLGGLFYGLAGVVQPAQPGIGATSVLLVLLSINALVGLAGGAAVAFGIAAAARLDDRWSVAGGAAGGFLVGAFAKLLGLDAFDLLFGRSPGDITGAAEGALLGGAVGAAAWIARRFRWAATPRRAAAVAAAAGGTAGLAITLSGGRLMAGSLDLLAHRLPDSRLRLDRLGAVFGEHGFGPIARSATGFLEGALFGGCVVGAMLAAQRALDRAAQR